MSDKKQTGRTDPLAIHIRPLEPGDWPLIVQLFGEKGACGGCWCMWPRVPRGGKLWEDLKGAKNKERFRRLVRADKVHGVLAFCGETPVGWCCFGPRGTFPRLETVRALKRDWSEDTWSIVCFTSPRHGEAVESPRSFSRPPPGTPWPSGRVKSKATQWCRISQQNRCRQHLPGPVFQLSLKEPDTRHCPSQKPREPSL